jgi:hypothetical protein
MSVTNIVEPAAPTIIDLTSEAEESAKLPVGALYRRKSAFSRKLKFFQRDMMRFRELLQKLKDDKWVQKDEESDGAKKYTDIIIGYKMLRALCISNNWIVAKKEDDKRFIPSKFEAELKTILGEDCVKGISEAMKMSNAEVVDHIHKEVKPKSMEKLLKFIKEHEKLDVTDVLEKAIEEMNTELEARKDEPRPKRNPEKKKRASPKRGSANRNEGTTEDKFRDLMKEVKGRIGGIKFSKDDFKLYSDTQQEVDALLQEATKEILDIKRFTQDRFEKVQRGGQGRRSNVRKPRDDSRNDLKVKKSGSVFSKDVIHEGDIEVKA